MISWKRDDILAKYREIINYARICELRAERLAGLDRPHWQQLRAALSRLPLGHDLSADGVDLKVKLQEAAVAFGSSGDLGEAHQADLHAVIQALIPWRKGPFSIFGIEVISEWDSSLKWNRIAPRLDPLGGKRVLDVGCGNGYYMFRMAEQSPELVLGIDPSESFYFAFELVQRFLQLPNLQYELLTSDELCNFAPMFDVVLCCGVIYHQKDPLGLLQRLREVMLPGAQLILESQAVSLDGPVALFPPDRYAKARNVFFLPTAECLSAWLTRAGFREVEVFSSVQLTLEEQRKTHFSPYESLADFLDPADPSRTVEGHPAPLRVAAHARK